MAIAILNGSHRQQSQSLRISRYIADRLPRQVPGMTAEIISLAGNPLPLWDEQASRKPDTPPGKIWAGYAEKLQAAAGFVIVSPEWAGMVPPGLKNFLLHCSPAELAHKPALIVAVSASRGGAYPVNELRTSGYKNNKLLYLPEHIIIREAGKMFAGEDPATPEDEYIRNRLDYALAMLSDYAAALAPARARLAARDAAYPNGM